MTINEAIQTAIDQLEGVRLPVRDEENASRVRTALILLEALKGAAATEPNHEGPKEPDEEKDGESA